MKFVILCTFLMTSAVSSESTTISFPDCDPGNWVITNTTLKYENGIKCIDAKLIYNELGDQRIYNISIAIPDCDKNDNSCSGDSVSIDNVKCKDFSKSENDPCTVAKEVADMEKNEQWLTQTNEDLYNTIHCF